MELFEKASLDYTHRLVQVKKTKFSLRRMPLAMSGQKANVCIMRVFALKKITENSSIILEKGQILSGMLLVVFAVDESQKKRTRPPHHRRRAGRQHQFLNLDMVR